MRGVTLSLAAIFIMFAFFLAYDGEDVGSAWFYYVLFAVCWALFYWWPFAPFGTENRS